MNTIQRHVGYKYRILYLLKNLKKLEHDCARRFLPKHLKVSKQTFKRWMYIPADSCAEIPFDKAFLIAEFFEIPIKRLFENPPSTITVEEMNDLFLLEFIPELK